MEGWSLRKVTQCGKLCHGYVGCGEMSWQERRCLSRKVNGDIGTE